MGCQSKSLLDDALGLNQQQAEQWPLIGKIILIEDRVETSASFLLHQLTKRILSIADSYHVIIFLAFAGSFSHYDRILRKLGCNLQVQKDNNRFWFLDLRMPYGNEERIDERGFSTLFGNIKNIICALSEHKSHVTIMIDDVSVMEVVAKGSSDHVLDFLHYCYTLTSEFGCSLVTLVHVDVYLGMEETVFLLQMEYDADVLMKIDPFITGLATDVHGQLTVLNKGWSCEEQGLKISNFHFKLKENNVEYFYPGRTLT